jgi:hypothetical protein
MMHRCIATLAALLALVVPASARGATEWEHNWTPIPEGERVTVETSGPKVTFDVQFGKATPTKVTCAATGTEAFWNTPFGGEDEVASIAVVCPQGTSITPILPWTSVLVGSPLPLHDQWEHMALDLTLNGVEHGMFTGSLDSVYGDVDPLKEREEEKGRRDEDDSYLKFTGAKSVLTGPNNGRLYATGVLHVGGKLSFITDEDGVFQ